MNIPYWDIEFEDIFLTKVFWVFVLIFFFLITSFRWRLILYSGIINFLVELALSLIVSVIAVAILFLCYFGVRFIFIDLIGWRKLANKGNYF